ncbi:MAG: triosephosphate isomerase [Candidatus Levybacteria bacterium]|nr:triosephosphate isomerase [Candidatus Levybacteria bacterium]MBP9814751.1 triosephosphate isomerase [Candidatus Levybacteria bacterium]
MEKKRIIANWKSYKTAEETVLFLDSLKAAWDELPMQNKEIIILPSYMSLSTAYVYKETEGLPIFIGAQDISTYDEGPYTGEVSGRQISEFCQFVLINHSERRRYNHEGDQEARAKVIQAQKYNLTPLYCVQDEQAAVPDNISEIVYEPPSAISTFQQGAKVQDSAEIERVFSVLGKRYPQANLYYGGSVDSESIKSLVLLPHITGFLVGSASLNPESFAKILMAW